MNHGTTHCDVYIYRKYRKRRGVVWTNWIIGGERPNIYCNNIPITKTVKWHWTGRVYNYTYTQVLEKNYVPKIEELHRMADITGDIYRERKDTKRQSANYANVFLGRYGIRAKYGCL